MTFISQLVYGRPKMFGQANKSIRLALFIKAPELNARWINRSYFSIGFNIEHNGPSEGVQ